MVPVGTKYTQNGSVEVRSLYTQILTTRRLKPIDEKFIQQFPASAYLTFLPWFDWTTS